MDAKRASGGGPLPPPATATIFKDFLHKNSARCNLINMIALNEKPQHHEKPTNYIETRRTAALI